MLENQDKKYVGYKGLAALGINKNTAYSLVHQKRIPHVRLGNRYVLFDIEAVKEWLKSHEVSVQGAVQKKD